MIIPLLAFLSIEIKDFFLSLLFFFLFNLALFLVLILKGFLYLGIFQMGMFTGTAILLVLLKMGE